MYPILLRALLVFVTIFACPKSEAYSFTPTDVEWQGWPGYCKAKYVWTPIGKNSKFASYIGLTETAELKPWEDAGVRGLHHYCTGAIWLNRARLEKDPVQRNYMLRNAKQETQFTFDRSPRSAPHFAPVAIQMATILYEQGELNESLQLLQSLIVEQPQNEALYSATAVMQRSLGRLLEAKETLLKGLEAVDGKSAEINYNLGLVSIELGEIDEAVQYAEMAYELGFPLPGLRTKLEKLGRMSLADQRSGN